MYHMENGRDTKKEKLKKKIDSYFLWCTLNHEFLPEAHFLRNKFVRTYLVPFFKIPYRIRYVRTYRYLRVPKMRILFERKLWLYENDVIQLYRTRSLYRNPIISKLDCIHLRTSTYVCSSEFLCGLYIQITVHSYMRSTYLRMYRTYFEMFSYYTLLYVREEWHEDFIKYHITVCYIMNETFFRVSFFVLP